MEGWVAVTHNDWFDFLAGRRHRDEVNFWSPSDYYTFHGTRGAPFFFKLKAPRNAIGGFGHVAAFSRLPDWLAWQCFGEGNGAASFEEFRKRLDELRDRNQLRGTGTLQQIGCIVLVNAVFFRPEEWIEQPRDWPMRNLRYKRYDLATGEGARVWQACLERVAGDMTRNAETLVAREDRPRYGEPILVRPRLGQGAFRVAVTDAYGRACAITGEHSLPVLEAAHIMPFALGGPHEVTNGLLLRSDLHRLFDLGYVTITPRLHFEVSPRLRGEFENGRSYYPLHGRRVHVPRDPGLRPDPVRLRWHNEHTFRA